MGYRRLIFPTQMDCYGLQCYPRSSDYQENPLHDPVMLLDVSTLSYYFDYAYVQGISYAGTSAPDDLASSPVAVLAVPFVATVFNRRALSLRLSLAGSKYATAVRSVLLPNTATIQGGRTGTSYAFHQRRWYGCPCEARRMSLG